MILLASVKTLLIRLRFHFPSPFVTTVEHMIMKTILSLMALLVATWAAAAVPLKPTMATYTNGGFVELNWSRLEEASGYTLRYAPYPSGTPVESIDLGNSNLFSATLPAGISFYVAVQGYNSEGEGEVSDVKVFNTNVSNDAVDPRWQSCVTPANFSSQTPLEQDDNAIQVTDKWGRDITSSGMVIVDWEGFLRNPESVINIDLPSKLEFPVSLRVSATNAPRLFMFDRVVYPEDPYGVYDSYSVHNSDGPLWGVNLETIEPFEDVFPGQRQVWGGIGHDLSDQQLETIGLVRNQRGFAPEDFPKQIRVGIHPDREAGNETYALKIIAEDASGSVLTSEMPVYICDQDLPARATEFKFHVDYTTDFFDYLQGTDDGLAVSSYAELALDDIAYFFEDMRFDTIPEGGCEAFVNFEVEEFPGTARNSSAYDDGFYIFLNSHSGGGSLPGTQTRTRNGQSTDFFGCGFWGQNLREGKFQLNVESKVYASEDDWWRVNLALYGQSGECIEDTIGQGGLSCIECPDGREWCAYRRSDVHWANTHELSHGLVYSDWPVWKQWHQSPDRCVRDPVLLAYSGVCMPIHWDDHIGSEDPTSKRSTEFARNPYSKLDYLIMGAAGWDLRDSTAFTELNITTQQLRGGFQGGAYNESIRIEGGVPSYKFSVDGGELPPGLALNTFTGLLTGDLEKAGSYSFTILVNDSGPDNVLARNGESREYTIDVLK